MRIINADAFKNWLEIVPLTDDGGVDINDLEEYINAHTAVQPTLYGIIDEQPTVPQWIPCSKRMPKQETDVLVTRSFLGCKDYRHGWNAHIPPTTYVEVAAFICGKWLSYTDEYKVSPDKHTDPIAWMPLPEPYKGGEE